MAAACRADGGDVFVTLTRAARPFAGRFWAHDTTGGGAPSADCGTMLAPKLPNTKSVVSDKVIDYTLEGAPAAQHFDVALLLFDGTSRSTTPDPEAYDYTFYTPKQLGDLFFNDPNGVHAYLSEASFGKVSLSGRRGRLLRSGRASRPAGDSRTRAVAGARKQATARTHCRSSVIT